MLSPEGASPAATRYIGRAMSRPFLKMNGLGNDFVVVEARSQPFAPSDAEARAIASREGGGVGCDQLIAIEASPRADAFMRIWNSDGGQVEHCGNAARCVGWLLMEATGRDAARLDTPSGVLEVSRAGTGQVTIDMGKPRLDWREIPLAEAMDTRGIELQVGPIDAPLMHTPGCVSMGNPHVVFFVPDAEIAPVREVGSMIEHQRRLLPGQGARPASLAGLGARRGFDPRLRHGGLRGPRRGAPPGLLQPAGDGGDGRRGPEHRVAQERRPRADDRPGRS